MLQPLLDALVSPVDVVDPVHLGHAVSHHAGQYQAGARPQIGRHDLRAVELSLRLRDELLDPRLVVFGDQARVEGHGDQLCVQVPHW